MLAPLAVFSTSHMTLLQCGAHAESMPTTPPSAANIFMHFTFTTLLDHMVGLAVSGQMVCARYNRVASLRREDHHLNEAPMNLQQRAAHAQRRRRDDHSIIITHRTNQSHRTEIEYGGAGTSRPMYRPSLLFQCRDSIVSTMTLLNKALKICDVDQVLRRGGRGTYRNVHSQ